MTFLSCLSCEHAVVDMSLRVVVVVVVFYSCCLGSTEHTDEIVNVEITNNTANEHGNI